MGGQPIERGLAGGRGCGHRPPLSPVLRSFTRRTGARQRPLRGGELPSLSLCHSRESGNDKVGRRSEEHTSELQSLMRISYAVFCLKKKKKQKKTKTQPNTST